MLRITGQVVFDDYLRAQRYHERSRTILIAVILGGMAVLAWLSTRNLLFPAFAALYVVVVRPVYVRLRLKRHWQQTPSAHAGERTYGLDESGFHAEDDEGNTVVTHWDKFLKFRETSHSFLLYLSPRMYVFLPKRFMNPEDQQEIQELLERRIGPTSQATVRTGASATDGNA
jgi:hypothetical protein